MSDHFSGPRAVAGPQCDICDFFAFPAPGHPGNLVLAMDLVPLADASSTFSPAIVHRFRVRSASTQSRAIVPGSDELTVDVRFAAGPGRRTGTCTTSVGRSVPMRVDESTQAGGLRAFAGLRADPFFLDFPAMQETLATGRLSFTDPGTLTGPAADTLGIVVEIDREVLADAGVGPLVAAVAETLSAGPLPIRLERVGRPEVKNLLLALRTQDPVNQDIDLRDLYNLEDPFHVGPDYRDAYRARLDANLAYMDTLDGAIGWPLGPDGEHPLTELFLADHLVANPFFGPWRSSTAASPRTCGCGPPGVARPCPGCSSCGNSNCPTTTIIPRWLSRWAASGPSSGMRWTWFPRAPKPPHAHGAVPELGDSGSSRHR